MQLSLFKKVFLLIIGMEISTVGVDDKCPICGIEVDDKDNVVQVREKGDNGMNQCCKCTKR